MDELSICMYTFFFSIYVITDYWDFSVLYSRSLLIIYFVYSKVYVNPSVLIYSSPRIKPISSFALMLDSCAHKMFQTWDVLMYLIFAHWEPSSVFSDFSILAKPSVSQEGQWMLRSCASLVCVLWASWFPKSSQRLRALNSGAWILCPSLHWWWKSLLHLVTVCSHPWPCLVGLLPAGYFRILMSCLFCWLSL